MRPDLRARILTAAVLIPLVLIGIFCLGQIGFGLASAIVILWAAWEWAYLSGIQKIFSKIAYVFLIAICLVASLYGSLIEIFIIGIMGWIFAFIGRIIFGKQTQKISIIEKLSGLILLPACWRALNFLCFLPPHPYRLLSLFLIVWLADIGAYFVGSRFGKHKLAPSISPGKSIEGVIGALGIVGIIVALIFHSLSLVLLALLTVIASIMGDLLESAMKRRQGVKDSGKCLPGHGGILDRIDSLITAAPVFALGVEGTLFAKITVLLSF